jgi:hypothetical protein
VNFTTKIIIAAAVLIALALGVIFLWPGGEGRELKDVVLQLAEKARKGDVEGCLQFVAADFDYKGETYEDVARQIRRYVSDPACRSLEVDDLEAVMHGGEDGRATFTVRVGAEFAGRSFTRSANVSLEFRKTDEIWKIIGYEVESEDRW